MLLIAKPIWLVKVPLANSFHCSEPSRGPLSAQFCLFWVFQVAFRHGFSFGSTHVSSPTNRSLSTFLRTSFRGGFAKIVGVRVRPADSNLYSFALNFPTHASFARKASLVLPYPQQLPDSAQLQFVRKAATTICDWLVAQFTIAPASLSRQPDLSRTLPVSSWDAPVWCCPEWVPWFGWSVLTGARCLSNDSTLARSERNDANLD